MLCPLVVNGKFGQTSKGPKILWPWLSAKFCFAFYVFINSSNCERHILAAIYFAFLGAAYVGLALWGGGVGFGFYFSAGFCWCWRGFGFGGWGGGAGVWGLGYISLQFWDFPNISKFLKILSINSFGHSWDNTYIPCLLVIITLCFTCGARKI